VLGRVKTLEGLGSVDRLESVHARMPLSVCRLLSKSRLCNLEGKRWRDKKACTSAQSDDAPLQRSRTDSMEAVRFRSALKHLSVAPGSGIRKAKAPCRTN